MQLFMFLKSILILILPLHLLLPPHQILFDLDVELVRWERLGENICPIGLTPDESEADDPCNNSFSDSVVGQDIVLRLQGASWSGATDNHALVIAIPDGGPLDLNPQNSQLVSQLNAEFSGNIGGKQL